MGGRNGRRGDEPLAVVAVAGAAVVRGLVRPTPVEAEDWCPDLVLARLGQRRAAEGPAGSVRLRRLVLGSS